ncbi:arylsulfatase [Sediminicola luteus]|uniref:Sulfatase N-terminal domain-containing protein n=1 Tax=Sediminicola luteus TaxID=319238 RepID=A0A2A4GFE7_9FLAO|nr:arylsulfatase [Sediminicola luteus]PCE66700.1 hypothetical protein B7P33_05260 [Sediminicola luteus]
MKFRNKQKMVRQYLTGALGLILFIGCAPKKTSKKPNIVYILADDLGYGDIGPYGQKNIHTPNLDLLAQQGMLFTQHYSGSAVCAPSRCALMTGKHSGRGDIRGNARFPGASEGQIPLKEETVTIAQVLQKQGYKTGIIGKWGLGYPGSSGSPENKGFDFFYGFNCQTHAHGYYPTYLWKNQDMWPIENPDIPLREAMDTTGIETLHADLFKKYQGQNHANDLMLAEGVKFIKDQAKNPFFLYYASPLPHVALQVPENDLELYSGTFEETPYLGQRGYVPNWEPKATYAAMISKLDNEVGTLIQTLKDQGIYQNTLVIFASDNGPSVAGGANPQHFNSSGGLRNHKGSVYEGGIRVPMIASWPGNIKAGSISGHVSAFWDIFPTLAEVAGAPSQNDIDGLSLLPTLLGKKQAQHDHLYWEYNKSQSVIQGDWKGVRHWSKGQVGSMELYHLKNDPKEQHDLAKEQPAIIAKMEKIMESREPSPISKWNFKK